MILLLDCRLTTAYFQEKCETDKKLQHWICLTCSFSHILMWAIILIKIKL